jgi:hypothetical protein
MDIQFGGNDQLVVYDSKIKTNLSMEGTSTHPLLGKHREESPLKEIETFGRLYIVGRSRHLSQADKFFSLKFDHPLH